MTPLLRVLALCVLSDDGIIIAHSGTDCNESLTTFTVSCGFGNSFFAFGQEDGTFSPQSAILFYSTAVELPQHAVGGQKLQIQRDHVLKAAGSLVPELGVVALQRELAAHDAQQPGDQAQLIGKGGVQQKVRRGLEALDIPGLAEIGRASCRERV